MVPLRATAPHLHLNQDLRERWMQSTQEELIRIAALLRQDPKEYQWMVGGALRTLIAPRGLSLPHDKTPVQRLQQNCLMRGTGVASGPLEFVRGSDSSLADAVQAPVLLQSAHAFEGPLNQLWNSQGGRSLSIKVLLGMQVDSGSEAYPVDTSRHARFVGYTHGYNRTLFAERGGDLLAGIEMATLDSSGLRTTTVTLHGDRLSSPWMVVAAALNPGAVKRIAVDYTWNFDRISSTEDPNFLPGAMRWGGMDFFSAMIAPTPMLLIGIETVPALI
ncbi:MAG: hypothetical protein ACI9F9_000784 [Candidatus Paceibacteria bacterium]